MVLRVTADIKTARRKLNAIERRQIPFAVSLALNNTAFEVRNYIVRTLYPNAFPKARNKRFPGVAFRVEKSSKRRLIAAVFDRLNRAFLPNHIQGRPKRPFSSGSLLVPVNAQRLQSGKIKARDRAIGGGGDIFKADMQGRGEAIWRRSRRGRLSMLYVLKQSTPVRRSFRFFRAGTRKAGQVWPREFSKALRRALATAR